MRYPIASAVSLLFLSACASAPEPEPTAPATTQAGATSKGLSAQMLAVGDCGLFLWNRTDASTFLFFQRAGEGVGLLYDGGDVAVQNTANDGELFDQFYTRSTWQLPDGRPLRLSLEPGEEIDGGRRIPMGVISSENAEGWEVKTPVAGVVACQLD